MTAAAHAGTAAYGQCIQEAQQSWAPHVAWSGGRVGAQCITLRAARGAEGGHALASQQASERLDALLLAEGAPTVYLSHTRSAERHA